MPATVQIRVTDVDPSALEDLFAALRKRGVTVGRATEPGVYRLYFYGPSANTEAALRTLPNFLSRALPDWQRHIEVLSPED